MHAMPAFGARLGALVALLLLLSREVAAAATSGRVEVFIRDLPGKMPPVREVYMKELHVAGSSSSKVYKLEGEGVNALRTGQWVLVEGRQQEAGGVAAAASGGGGAPAAPLLTVTSIKVEQQPNYKQRGVITSSSSGQRSAAEARGLLEPMVGAAASASAVLPREQLTLEAAQVSTLVLPLSLEGCPKPGGGTYRAPWYSQEDVEALVFEGSAAGSSWNTLGGLYRSCSHNQSALTRANSLVAPIRQLPCSGVTRGGMPFDSRQCSYADFVGWSEAAMDILAAQGVDVDKYLYKGVLLPPGTACDFVGLGYIGCDFTFPCSSWVQADIFMGASSGAASSVQSLFHEMGHNQFLFHAAHSLDGNSVAEYGDTSCSMGYCCGSRCFNMPHAWQLGWVAPQLLSGTSLGVGQTRAISLAAQSRSPLSGLKINANWVGGGLPPFYLSYRLAEGADAQLPQEYVGKLSVHSFAGAGSHSPELTTLLAILGSGQSWEHSASGLVVRNMGAAAGTATIRVCRKHASGKETRATCLAGLDGDCDGKVGGADAECQPFLPRLPRPPPRSARPPPPRPRPRPPLPTASAAKNNVSFGDSCRLGNQFCTDVAKHAKQANPTVSFFVETKAGALAGLCQHLLKSPRCARSQRCAKGHATCAARRAGSVCQYWLAKPGKLPTCTGTGIECNCAKVMAARPSQG